ncbi:MAG: DUF4252 domain-containing protein, partial [Bacteroidales bacterium]|nr:DUF4252 domain-containing protein [Bacteroidales bacterium]
SAIFSLFLSANLTAQNPIDEYLKKYPSREGVTSVSVSKEMLESMYAQSSIISPDGILISAYDGKISSTSSSNVPEMYSSITIATTEISSVAAQFKELISKQKYESYMEMNKNGTPTLGYYLKKNKQSNEFVILKQDKDHFSAIYLKGEIEIKQVDNYLRNIRSHLGRMRMGMNSDVESIMNVAVSGISQIDIEAIANDAIRQKSVQIQELQQIQALQNVLRENFKNQNESINIEILDLQDQNDELQNLNEELQNMEEENVNI